MNERARSTVAGIIAWGTFGAINGAVVAAMLAREIGIAGPHPFAVWIGATVGAAFGITGWLIRGHFKKRS